MSPGMFARDKLEIAFLGFECGVAELTRFVRDNFYYYAGLLIASSITGLPLGGALAIGVMRDWRGFERLADRVGRLNDRVLSINVTVLAILGLTAAVVAGPLAGYRWGDRQARHVRETALSGRCPTFHTVDRDYRGCLLLADAQKLALVTRSDVVLISLAAITGISTPKSQLRRPDLCSSCLEKTLSLLDRNDTIYSSGVCAEPSV